MKRLQIDIDEDKDHQKLSIRQRAGVYILFVIFQIVFPLKYSHQADCLWEEIKKSFKEL